jgi:heme-degrading monooxygenase HmoA
MFMRLLQLKLKPEFIEEFNIFYDSTVIPELQNLPGCIFAGLIKSAPQSDEFISLTLWKTQDLAEEYEKSGPFKNLFDQAKKYLAESSEWKVSLSENMELQYGPENEEPVVKKYIVSSINETDDQLITPSSNMFIRILSLVIQNEKIDEFRNLYSDFVIPALKATRGCRYVYLTESVNAKNEFISVTIWNTKEDAGEYEASEQYRELTDKVKHTFSQLYLWRMSLEKDNGPKVKTSDDFKVEHYKIITGKNFL